MIGFSEDLNLLCNSSVVGHIWKNITYAGWYKNRQNTYFSYVSLFLIIYETDFEFSPSLLSVRSKAVEFPQKQIQMVRSLRSLYNVKTYD